MIFALFGGALLAGCAKGPESISPTYISEIKYQDWKCEQLASERARVADALTTASAQQEQARSNDVIGVILLGLPLASLSGDNIAPEVARLKGERDALGRASNTRYCATARASVGSSTPGAGPETAAVTPSDIPVRARGRMSEAELRSIMPDAVFRGTSARGYGNLITYHRNGSLSGLSESQSDTGKWAIEGGNVCTTWSKWRSAKTTCWYLEKEGDTYTAYFADTGKLNAKGTLSRE